ncbi:hypothetical protein GO755_38710 [Spirosoma sp. HMF4905]|uniref:Bacteriophage tail tape measure N-terminal domain-containing protein n=1 Tax=Spirosoma arboris TaxID=2682092 RepID=A0A7K1SQI7_9BACT|nr:hypothetical protein [Spirosoma arboris]MVM36010.1 hypothetical protein [Spirosoma arboris]
MGAGAVNIALGLTITDLLRGFNTAGATVRQFTSLTQSQFNSLNGVGSIPAASVASITTAMGLANRQINPLIAGLGNLRQSGIGLTSLASGFGSLFAVDKIVGFGSAIAEASGKSEKYFAILRNGLGSSTGAKDNLSMLTDFAASTPFGLDELTGSFVKFVNRGITPTKKELTNLGDLAASQGKGFDQLTEAILDAQSGEFERLKEFGIKAAKSGDSVTLSFKGVTQTIKNTSDEITKAIYGFGQLGGVAGGMAAVSQTLEGKLSNLGDSFDRLLVALGEAGVAGGFKEAIDMGQRFLSFVTELIAKSPVEDLRAQQTELNGLVGALALASDNEGVRLNLIQRLKQEYPEFLGNLNSESITTDLLSTRLAAVNEQYERKIRIALGQQKIQKATEAVTQAIDQQSNALRQLSLASGQSVTDLEKLSSTERIALARRLAAEQPQQNLGMGVSGPGPLSAVATVLEQAGRQQATAQAELNNLLAENATRQADLTTETVSGYKQQIGLIQEKIKLHKIEKAEGLAEIKRLNDQILIAQGKQIPVTPTLSTKPTVKVKVEPLLDTSNLSVFKRYAEQLKKEIQAIGPTDVNEGDSDAVKRSKAMLDALLKQKQAEFVAINDSINQLESRVTKTTSSPVAIPGLSEIASPATREVVAGIVEQVGKLKESTPGIFTNTGLSGFISSLGIAKPSLEFYRNKLNEIQATIANFPALGLPIPKDAIDLLALYTQKVNEAERALEAAKLAAENQRLASLPKLGGVQLGGLNLQLFNDSANTLTERSKQLGASVTSAIQGAASSSITALGEWVGGMFAGTEKLGNLPIAIGGIFANLAKVMGSSLVAFGTAGLAAKAFVGNPIGAIAAGLALTVLGSALQATMQKQVSGIKDFAGGGLFTGESIIRVGENARALRGGGEFVAPVALGADLISTRIMENLQPTLNPNLRQRTVGLARRSVEVNLSGEFKLRGTDLYWSLERTKESLQFLL